MTEQNESISPYKLLQLTWQGDHSVQTPDIYPHQWYTESVMASLGWSQEDPQRAAMELTTLIRHGQWSNGMIPHQIYAQEQGLSHSVVTNLPFLNDRRYWKHTLAPAGSDTSAITQPPTLAMATQAAARVLTPDNRVAFLNEMVPALTREAEWIYRERDYGKRGLATTLHPYESGMNYTPAWISVIEENPPRGFFSTLSKGAGALATERVVQAARSDKQGLDSKLSMKLNAGLLAVQLSRNLGKLPQDPSYIRDNWPYQVEDISYNSALVRNNQLLRELANEVGTALDDNLLVNMVRTEENFDDLYQTDAIVPAYYSRITGGEAITIETVGCLLPLYAGHLSMGRQKELISALLDPARYRTPFPVPTVPKNSSLYEAATEDSGGVKPFITYQIADGLIRAGEKDLARDLLKPTIDVLEATGAKAISSFDGSSLDKNRSSGTAGIVLNIRATGLLLAMRNLHRLAA